MPVGSALVGVHAAERIRFYLVGLERDIDG
jgi:hypothetical protein